MINQPVEPVALALTRDDLVLPDAKGPGRGMVAGGAIAPLRGAVYLTPLDRAMQALEQRLGIRYQRSMDDWVILAPSRHKLRRRYA